MSDKAIDHLNKSGVEFAEIEDAGQAALRAIADPNINGLCMCESVRTAH